jgi:DNA-directed RNA polymerase subunit RPC12/RpoP
MAVEIIGHDPSVARVVTCKACGSQLKYWKVDVMDQTSQYFDETSTRYYITCAKCSTQVTVKAWF